MHGGCYENCKTIMTYQKVVETIIIFTTYRREEISIESIGSLCEAIKGQNARIIVNDASPEVKDRSTMFFNELVDYIWTPSFTSAATSRNIAVEYAKDKYVPEYICFVEDDYLYESHWYRYLVDVCKRNYGKKSPLGLAYGVFSASRHRLEKNRIKFDKLNGLTAYIFGAVADQRFMPYSHYINVFRFWDPDVLGVSYCQTGMQTGRNTMNGFCGGIIQEIELCAPIPETVSTWSSGKRDVGPPAHSLNPKDFNVIIKTIQSKFEENS